jgi:hypothetical protein
VLDVKAVCAVEGIQRGPCVILRYRCLMSYQPTTFQKGHVCRLLPISVSVAPARSFGSQLRFNSVQAWVKLRVHELGE